MPKQKHTATFKARVVLEMLKEEKTVAQIAAEHQIHPGQLHRWKRQAVDNFIHLFTESEMRKQQAHAHDQELTELYAQIGKLTTQVEWLKKNLASTLSRAERGALLDRGDTILPLTVQTTLLSLARSSQYYRPVGPNPAEVGVEAPNPRHLHRSALLWGRRMTVQLQREGHAINRKRVQRYMREMGIWGIAPGPHTSTRYPGHPVYPCLLKEVTPAYQNRRAVTGNRGTV